MLKVDPHKKVFHQKLESAKQSRLRKQKLRSLLRSNEVISGLEPGGGGAVQEHQVQAQWLKQRDVKVCAHHPAQAAWGTVTVSLLPLYLYGPACLFPPEKQTLNILGEDEVWQAKPSWREKYDFLMLLLNSCPRKCPTPLFSTCLGWSRFLDRHLATHL